MSIHLKTVIATEYGPRRDIWAVKQVFLALCLRLVIAITIINAKTIRNARPPWCENSSIPSRYDLSK